MKKKQKNKKGLFNIGHTMQDMGKDWLKWTKKATKNSKIK